MIFKRIFRKNAPTTCPAADTLRYLATLCDALASDSGFLPYDRRDLERRASAYRLQAMIEEDRDLKSNQV